MPTPTSGNYYRFRSLTTQAVRQSHSVGYFLNCNSASSGPNGYYRDGSTDQIWRFDGTRLIGEKTAQCLSRASTTGTAVQVGATTLAASLSQISFELVSGNNYRIKVGGTTSPKYLTATVTSSSANASISLTWASILTSDTTNRQTWEVDRLIKVTGMPSTCGYPNNSEYFHPNAGWTQGTYSANSGATKMTSLKALYRKCYGLSTNAAVSDTQVFLNLYGAMTTGSATWQDGSFHLGYDFNSGSKIYAPYSGTVRNTPNSNGYGEVTIQVGSQYYVLMHMSINTGTYGPKRDTAISATPNASQNNNLGTESNAGVSQRHLHIELANSNTTGLRAPIASSNSALTTIRIV